uniref:Heat shock transcription factor A5 n=1 Tax=Narcissus tazetta subsp. chinensis TaxID=391288 RepID=A0A411JIC6_NARTA|nr:heat shock transcription factor A5 [Narcissus tazetta subsp. chinensis]
MEAAATCGGGAGGGPAPFLMKTYEMVDDCSTDDIVSWSSTNSSFVVWNPTEFAAKLLPTYFKHNNFSSFIRQLNTYGFRKIDPERWEFANDEFIKDHKHLLKNIHRRKPIHSHSHPPPGSSSSVPSSSSSSFSDPERTALEEEIERLSREKVALAADLWRFQQQQSGTKIQLEDLERRLSDMERRQAKMISFLERALPNPRFVENLIRMAGSGADFSSILHKKRRLPGVIGYCLEIAENSCFHQNSSNSSSNTSSGVLKPLDAGQVFNGDFCDKLKLGLCPAAISESNNVVAASTQSSSEAMEQRRNGNGALECLSLVPDAVELSDTGTSLCPRKSCLFSEPVDDDDDNDDGGGGGLVLCHLNLTLASSSSMQIDKSATMSRSPPSSMHDEGIVGKEDDATGDIAKNQSNATGDANGNSPPLQGASRTGHQETPTPPRRVNDVFWEQFLTERPGSSDTEEASSSLRADPSDDLKDEGKIRDDSTRKDRKDIDRLSP